MTLTSDDELRDKVATGKFMLELMKKGILMPFLGAGINLANRPLDAEFTPGGQYLPDAAELSQDIAREFDYPWGDMNLLRVSWYAAATRGKDVLYHHLHGVFSREYPWTDVHEFFARLRKRFAAKGYQIPPQLIVTTNYDQLLERAFDAEGEPYDVFSYVVQSDSEVGKFEHIPHGGTPKIVDDPRTYNPSISHTVILKIHGAVGPSWDRSTFVITEDDYIDYAALLNPDHIPAVVKVKMLHCRFLYLGYSLSDWNLRVLLRGISVRSRFRGQQTWAIMSKHEVWDRLYWKEHDVRLIKVPLSQYIAILNTHLDEVPNNNIR